MNTSSPRWILCARSRGIDPEKMREHDGNCAPFICWISRRWREWRAARKVDANYSPSTADHADFDAWLEGRVERGDIRDQAPTPNDEERGEIVVARGANRMGGGS